MATNLIDYQASDKYQVQPFYGAGSTIPLKWVHRKEGTHYSSAALIYDTDTDVSKESGIAIVGSAGNGIAGTTYYQVQAQLIKP